MTERRLVFAVRTFKVARGGLSCARALGCLRVGDQQGASYVPI